MASINFVKGQIKDRTKGYPPISYCVPKTSKAFMEKCLKAHELLISIMDNENRLRLASLDLKTTVLRYVALDDIGKQEIVKGLALQGFSQKQKEISMNSLAELWFEQKIAEGVTESYEKSMRYDVKAIVRFFNETGIASTADLDCDTAHKFLKWRSNTTLHHYMKQPISASTMRYELTILKQMAKIAARSGYISNGSIWDDVKVKTIAGVNKKIVEPLTIEAQMELLTNLANTPHHDTALLLLITGIRIGELDTMKPSSIKNSVLYLHGESIGNYKPIGGKTASASRTLPVCPTLIELFNRGNIFKTTANAFQIVLRRFHKGIHAHRLRHTFAVNKLLAQTPLQMVSYQIGHSEISMTADLYGKFVPEHFKAGFEETIKIRKEHLDYLENHYFLL